ncbi:protein FLX-like 4 [Canna indica]|uniref:Protein FLX-like 4 n=1 Tax=Canna indica TaxID=4628 RepID=A0AAQ3Q281_9LILI|nr:protein FLX-like 4 [Canna indica]
MCTGIFNSKSVFLGDNPFEYFVPLLLFDIAFLFLAANTTNYVLKRFSRYSRFVAELGVRSTTALDSNVEDKFSCWPPSTRHQAQNQIIARRELNAEIQLVTEEVEKTSSESKKFSDLHSELDGLRQEHQNLRSTFEYEKGLNIELVERMRGMETNLMSMAREVERLRTEVTAAEHRINAPNQYVGTYPQPAQAAVFS